MTDEEVEKALNDKAYEINYGNKNDIWIIPKDKLSQEALAYIDRLKEACQSAIQSFTRMETLYKVKCTEIECVEEKIRKQTAKEIIGMLYCIPTTDVDELNHLALLKMRICEKYGVGINE